MEWGLWLRWRGVAAQARWVQGGWRVWEPAAVKLRGGSMMHLQESLLNNRSNLENTELGKMVIKV